MFMAPALFRSIADVGHQRHEAGPLDGILDRALERGAVAAAFTAHHLTLHIAELLQGCHVLVVHEGGARAALLRAEAAAILPATSHLLADHLSAPIVGGKERSQHTVV